MEKQNYGTLEEVPKNLDEWCKWLGERRLMTEFYRIADVNAGTISRARKGQFLMVRTRRKLLDAYIKLRQEYGEGETENNLNQKVAC